MGPERTLIERTSFGHNKIRGRPSENSIEIHNRHALSLSTGPFLIKALLRRHKEQFCMNSVALSSCYEKKVIELPTQDHSVI